MNNPADAFKQFARAIDGFAADLDNIFADRILVCTVCGFQRPMQPGEGSQFAFSGWPKHCDLTMRLSKPAPSDD